MLPNSVEHKEGFTESEYNTAKRIIKTLKIFFEIKNKCCVVDGIDNLENGKVYMISKEDKHIYEVPQLHTVSFVYWKIFNDKKEINNKIFENCVIGMDLLLEKNIKTEQVFYTVRIKI